MILRFLKAITAWIYAFVRAYDSEGGRSPEGFPLLLEWNGQNPYLHFMTARQKTPAADVKAALIFESGREKGECLYLPCGNFRLGSRLDYELIAREKEKGQPCLELEIAADAVFAKVENSKFFVNGHAVSSAQLVDQDECEYNGIRFFYLEAVSPELEMQDETICKEAV